MNYFNPKMCTSKARLDGKVAVVTGGGSGMGYETAKDLASRGARVIIASRNANKLEIARDEIRRNTSNQNVDFKVLDFESFQSIRNFSNEIRYEPRLDMLINNAGALALPDRLTEDGLSLMMQVNFFGAFLLTYLLLPMLKASAPSRIINVSAFTMYFGDIDFDHWNDLGKYSELTASGNAKLAEFITMAEWARRLKGTGITANTFDPFAIIKDSGVSPYLSDTYRSFSNVFLAIFGIPPKDVGQQLAYYASAPEMQNTTGQHFNLCQRAPRHWILNNMKLRQKLWKEAKRIVKITPQEDWEIQ